MGIEENSSLSASDGDLIGQVTARRLVRAVFSRWYVVFGALAVGAGIAAAVCAFLPPVYESVATFTLDANYTVSSSVDYNTSDSIYDRVSVVSTPIYSMNYAELFNTRYAEWRSEQVVLGILNAYRAKRPKSKLSDEELIEVLSDSVIDVKKYSRLVQVIVRASDPQLCTDLSTAYVDAIVANSDQQNAKLREQAVKLLDEPIGKQRERVTTLEHMTAASRVTNSLDAFNIDIDIVKRNLSHVTTQLLRLEGEEARLVEEAKLLAEVADDPSAYGRLTAGDSHSEEIARLAKECDRLEKECRSLLGAVTKKHPVVRQAGRELLTARARLKAAAQRAADSGQAALEEIHPRIEALKKRKAALEGERFYTERLIAMSKGEVSRDERALASAQMELKDLLIAQNRLANSIGTARETIIPGCPPTEPDKPVIPDPLITYGIAIPVALIIGVLIVLVMDKLDDPLIDLGQVMRCADRPVLALLPHVASNVRRDVVRLLVEAPFSEFAERIRGLRQLLESPQYEASSHRLLVVSTCPGEGKTITSASLAASFAQSGRHTLLVDFDMRRPQQASLWKLELTHDTSLSHVLTSASASRSPDFALLAKPSGIDGLDVIASLPPEGVDPATLAGSNVAKAFFAWAKLAYDSIVVDAPPFGSVADVVSLATLTGSVIVVCRPNRTKSGNLASCVEYLAETGAEVLGVVINDATAPGVSSFASKADGHLFRQCPSGVDPVVFDETRQFSDED